MKKIKNLRCPFVEKVSLIKSCRHHKINDAANMVEAALLNDIVAGY